MRQRVLDGAVQLLSRGSAAPVTTKAVADAANVSIGTVYLFGYSNFNTNPRLFVTCEPE